MPPRQNNPILGPLDINYNTIQTYFDPETRIYTDGERYYPEAAATRATLNIDGLTLQTSFRDYLETRDYISRQEFIFELNRIKEKIYQIMTEHVKLDITEEEFMDLLKE